MKHFLAVLAIAGVFAVFPFSGTLAQEYTEELTPEFEEEIYPYELGEEETVEFFKLEGYFRSRVFFVSGVEGANYFQTRLRLNPSVNPSPNISVKFQIDVLDDVVWGLRSGQESPYYVSSPTADIFRTGWGWVPGTRPCLFYSGAECEGAFPSRFLAVKRAWAETKIFVLTLKVGRQPEHFGLGAIYNDGEGFKNTWGDAHFGTTFDRISIEFGGEDWTISAGYDLLSQRLVENEIRGGITSRFFLKPAVDFGVVDVELLGAVRISDGNLWEGLGFARVEPIDGLLIETEGGVFLGSAGPTEVSKFAVVGRVSWDAVFLRLSLDAGFASDDDNPADNVDSLMTLNPDFNVGLLVFERVLASSSLAGGMPTLGGVSGSWYVMPTVSFLLYEAIGTWLSLVVAGDPQGEGGLFDRIYGWEIDWGFKLGGENFRIGVQLGYLIATDYLGLDSNPFEAQLRFTWLF